MMRLFFFQSVVHAIHDLAEQLRLIDLTILERVFLYLFFIYLRYFEEIQDLFHLSFKIARDAIDLDVPTVTS
jgi:hypothetical protein